MKTKLYTIVASLLLVLSGHRAASAEIITPDLVEKAKKEGEAVWYTTLPAPEAQAWTTLFTQKYGVKVNVFRAGMTTLTQKLQTEIPAGRWGFDLIQNRATNIEFYQKKGWVQKLNYPEKNQFIDRFVDNDDYWITLYMQPWVIGYNTNLVKPNDVPKSYQDLLDPKFKGKISFDEQDVDLYATLLKIMGKEKGREWFQKLVANNLQTRRGHTLETQLLSAGEFAVTASAYAAIVEVHRAKGAPIDWVAVEPVPVNIFGMGMAANPPHPNGAKLFLYWSLSAEALKSLNEISDRVPARKGVPLKNKKMENLMALKLAPVDISIAETYAEYNNEFLSLLGLKK